MIHYPDTNGSVATTGSKVMAERTPLHLPDWTIMAFVYDQAGPSFEGPEADSAIGGGGEQVSRVCGCGIGAGILWAVDGWRERDLKDRGRVANETTRARGGVILGRWENALERVAVNVPDTNVRFLGADRNEIVVIGELNAGQAREKSVVLASLAVEETYESRVLWNVNMQMVTPGATPDFMSAALSILNRSLFSFTFCTSMTTSRWRDCGSGSSPRVGPSALSSRLTIRSNSSTRELVPGGGG